MNKKSNPKTKPTLDRAPELDSHYHKAQLAWSFAVALGLALVALYHVNAPAPLALRVPAAIATTLSH